MNQIRQGENLALIEDCAKSSSEKGKTKAKPKLQF